MRLGLSIGYSRAQLDLPVALVQRAEELGYDTVWTAEAYGSDAVTPLAYLAAVTKRIKLGTGVMQLAARTPAGPSLRPENVADAVYLLCLPEAAWINGHTLVVDGGFAISG